MSVGAAVDVCVENNSNSNTNGATACLDTLMQMPHPTETLWWWWWWWLAACSFSITWCLRLCQRLTVAFWIKCFLIEKPPFFISLTDLHDNIQILRPLREKAWDAGGVSSCWKLKGIKYEYESQQRNREEFHLWAQTNKLWLDSAGVNWYDDDDDGVGHSLVWWYRTNCVRFGKKKKMWWFGLNEASSVLEDGGKCHGDDY